jgi:S1-C subfamily serine protease
MNEQNPKSQNAGQSGSESHPEAQGEAPVRWSAEPAWSQPAWPPQSQPHADLWRSPFGPRAAASRSDSGKGRVVGLVVGAAVLSAALSAGGTYVAVSMAPQVTAAPAATVQATTGTTAVGQTVTLTESDAIVAVATAAKPSVVTILSSTASGVTPFSVPATGAGSGFIVSADGLILTNNHVVAGTTTLTVTLDDSTELPATIVATDKVHDLALIKVNKAGLVPLTLGDSSAVKVGQLAIAIGSPLGTFTDSVTSGIVSGVDRSITAGDRSSRTTEDLTGLIQTDAAINPGNSGGPLLDASGTVVGVIVASASNAQSVGFAVPIDQAESLIASAR